MGSIGQRTGRLRRSWFVRVPVLAIGLVVALTLRDIVMGIVGGLLRLGSHAPQLWLGRTRTAVATTSAAAVYSIVGFVATVAIGFGLYSVYVRRMEQRPVSELARDGAAAEVAAGVGIGGALILVVVAALALMGDAQVSAGSGGLMAVQALGVAVTAACMEELVLRGLVLRLLERACGTWAALALSAAAFGGLHLINPHATWASALAIALTGGLVLGLAYIVTRRLWLAIGLHAAVNATEGALLGIAVSGRTTPGLFATHLSGPALLTGGEFGVEASVLLCVAGAIVAALLARRAIAAGQIVSRSQRPASPAQAVVAQ